MRLSCDHTIRLHESRRFTVSGRRGELVEVLRFQDEYPDGLVFCRMVQRTDILEIVALPWSVLFSTGASV